MDKIWDRKSFEVGGHWPLWRGWKNRMTTQNQQKSNAKNPAKTQKKRYICIRCHQLFTVFLQQTIHSYKKPKGI